MPTASPLVAPSSAPSWNETLTITGKFSQVLTVTNGKIFDTVEKEIYEDAVMEQYTVQFGEMKGEPFVVTDCSVIDQELKAGRRMRRYLVGNSEREEPIRRPGRSKEDGIPYEDQQQNLQQLSLYERQLQDDLLKIDVTFTMMYTSRYNIQVSEYPVKFKDYINGNLPAVISDMRNKFLPVATADAVLLFVDDLPTMEPTVPLPTSTVSPTSIIVPTTQLPTVSPTQPVPPPIKQPTDSTTTILSFIIGLGAGLGGATLIVIVLICYMRRKNARIRTARQYAQEAAGANEESIEIISADSPDAAGMGSSE